MITRINAFQSEDGQTHSSLEEAQKHAIRQLFIKAEDPETPNWGTDDIAGFIMNQKTKIVDILTTTATSNVRARKANGATRKPRAKKHIAEQFSMPPDDKPKDAA